MFKLIGGDGKQYGPVSAEDVRRWLSEGRLNAQSMAQREGETAWHALAEFPEFRDLLMGQRTAQAPPGVAVPAEIWMADVLARPAQLHFGQCFSRSWALLTSNAALLLGSVLVVWLISTVCRFIPFVSLIYLVMHGVLYGGLYLVFLKRIRGQPASVGDVFAGFTVAFVPLLLAGFLSSLLSGLASACCLVLPGIYLFVAWVFSVPLAADKGLEFWTAMEFSRKMVTRVWFQMFGLLVLAFIPFIIVSLIATGSMVVSIFPTVSDILSSGSPPGATQIQQLAARVVSTSLVLGGITRLVLLLNMPFALGALMYAYEDLFGPRPARAA